jgi:hypothetical protein
MRNQALISAQYYYYYATRATGRERRGMRS